MIKLTITYPDNEHSIMINSIEITSDVGTRTILMGHAPMILTISQREPISYKDANNKHHEISRAQGIARIDRTSVHLVLE